MLRFNHLKTTLRKNPKQERQGRRINTTIHLDMHHFNSVSEIEPNFTHIFTFQSYFSYDSAVV